MNVMKLIGCIAAVLLAVWLAPAATQAGERDAEDCWFTLGNEPGSDTTYELQHCTVTADDDGIFVSVKSTFSKPQELDGIAGDKVLFWIDRYYLRCDQQLGGMESSAFYNAAGEKFKEVSAKGNIDIFAYDTDGTLDDKLYRMLCVADPGNNGGLSAHQQLLRGE